ncbi:hypothetical protein PRZ48_011438 [Zasmidium cellare]|uniref:Heterokaryon incompatibility domain-containing protein n=1 Tax=Zasmidium cellare TaxID=395010 RepID=A0ABR0E6E4_ZASCE|nr:hypothetical protein PRZ48_011438 [Zasmidium cellare]
MGGELRMKVYTHTPLREPWEGHREIRLLTLQPGRLDADVRVKITIQTIPDEAPSDPAAASSYLPSWECLSYTWGDMVDFSTIYVELDNHLDSSANGVASFQVGSNLFAALQELRWPNQARVLWIDAICIDQSDTMQAKFEKAHQIPAMLEIYALSTRVIIWLGVADNDSDLALIFMNRLGESFEFNWTTYSMRSTAKLESDMLELLDNWDSQLAWTTPQHRAVCDLVARDWFGRVWTRQEAFAGSHESLVMCGSKFVLLPIFRNAIQLLGVRGLDVRDPNSEKNLDRLGLAISVLEKGRDGYSTILDLMSKIRSGQCKEPQDKIYGCLGMIKLLVNKAFADSIPTDYPDTVELFKQFFLIYFRHYNTIRLLETGGLCQESTLGGPSWLPDWTTQMTQLDQRLDLAVSHGMASEAEYDGGDVLKVVGVIAATVNKVDVLKHTGDLSSDNFGKSYAELARLMSENITADDGVQLEAFARALSVPLNGFRVPFQEVESRRHHYKNLVKLIMEAGSAIRSQPNIPFASLSHLDFCIRYCQQHRTPFIFTEDGHMGVSSLGAREGDCIAAVLGMNNLLLLRPSTNEEDGRLQYKLVGSCSVHGLNWGEALLGPLPDNFTVIPQVNPTVGNILPYFGDKRTGETTFWDPRIYWKELEVKPTDGPSYKIRAPPGDPERHVPTSDYFLRHGANLVQIELI